jgi:hypothetical protein
MSTTSFKVGDRVRWGAANRHTGEPWQGRVAAIEGDNVWVDFDGKTTGRWFSSLRLDDLELVHAIPKFKLGDRVGWDGPLGYKEGFVKEVYNASNIRILFDGAPNLSWFYGQRLAELQMKEKP